ncbi:methyltransferase domain-containing protein [Chitinophaga pinensis]|uniref:Methyltransferase domain-containing protein n=1 Tax=Chitinophaga pinensis TaxID=79329 RepID=A0A5C6LNI2_9BACT|nr:methyltransferase domain-containing protein [Chitinophaga pinensis]TWV98860.1 methyltransferase domain-containing protein [Chitinophaga pinensis]
MNKTFSPGYLYSADERPAIRKIKEKSYELMELQEGMKALDIGAGTGMDVLRMSDITGIGGQVVGLDADERMIEISTRSAIKAGRQTQVKFIQGHSHHLDFESDFFHACRCERVLQHLSIKDAAETLEEAARVTRHDGRIVFIDTDWASLSFHANDPKTERKVADICLWAIKNGFAARGLPELFSIVGIKDIQWEIEALQISLTEFEALITPIVDMYIRYGYVNNNTWQEIHRGCNSWQEKEFSFVH